jgi:hypothetical protein
VLNQALEPLQWELALADVTSPAAAIVRTADDASASREEVAFIQTALNRVSGTTIAADGAVGPQTYDALLRYARAAGLPSDAVLSEALLERLQLDVAASSPKPAVLLVQPTAESQVRHTRGKASAGVDLARLYQFRGFPVEIAGAPTVRDVRAIVERLVTEKAAPAVLHLSGGLREASGSIRFTFMAGTWYEESLGGQRDLDEFSVIALDSVLDSVPPRVGRPIVVLDVDSPYEGREAIGQLLLRNAFAAALFRLGHCSAVLATGLVGADLTDVYFELTSKLGDGATLADTAARLQSLRRFDLDEPGAAATALFTNLPWLRLDHR